MRRTRCWVLALALALGAAAVQAQLTPSDPDWRESDAPAPAPLRMDRLIPIDIPVSALRFSVDATSVMLGNDGVVRYVVIATSSSGVVNALYEGIRCGTGEVRLYARHNPDSGWVMVKEGLWRSIHDTRGSSRHSLVIARTGACVGNAPNRSANQIVRDLSGGVDRRS